MSQSERDEGEQHEEADEGADEPEEPAEPAPQAAGSARGPGRWVAWGLLGAWMVLFYPALLGLVSDRPSQGGLLVLGVLGAIAAALPGPGRWVRRALVEPAAPWFVGAVALASAALSWWVMERVLGGKVLALDSSVYLLQARALSHGSLGVPSEVPGVAQSARFLFEGPDGRFYGVFPPGFPLFLVPFVAAGAPMLAGPVTAALLVAAQYALGKAVGGDEWTARASLLLALPSYARAIETADLLSHAFVALLAAVAFLAALALIERPGLRPALALGAAVGWGACARLLDGLVLGLIVAALVAIGARGRLRALLPLLAAALLAAAPFGALLAAQQKAATGSPWQPTQYEFFRRSDFPPSCHRLGFGPDIGCSLEHPPERASFGPDGYQLDDALRVGSERAVVLGVDLLGFAPALLLAFYGLVAAPSLPSLASGAWWVGLSLAYLFFYYGNAPAYGARHLFPAAPFAYVLVARALLRLPGKPRGGRFDQAHLAGGALLVLIVLLAVTQFERWRRARWSLGGQQAARPALHRMAGEVRDAIVLTDDLFGLIAALDPWRDRGVRRVAMDDHAGVIELRRAHPGWAVLRATPTALLPASDLPPVQPGFSWELEQAWPSRVWPSGLGVRRVETDNALKTPSSGGEALGINHASEGGSVEARFDVLQPGRFVLSLEGIAGPVMGKYEVSLDEQPLFVWDGYAPRYGPHRSSPDAPIELAAGVHRLRLRCVGKDARASGLLAVFDVLRGVPAP